MQVDNAAWVTVYNSSASRTADSSRSIDTNPTPGSGVIAEIITSAADTVYFTPAVIGYNSDDPISVNLPLKVYNNGTQTVTITVTLNILQLEAS